MPEKRLRERPSKRGFGAVLVLAAVACAAVAIWRFPPGSDCDATSPTHPATDNKPVAQDIQEDAGTGHGALSGSVVTADGQPATQARVSLTGPNGVVQPLTSDEQGRFTAADLPEGVYSVFARRSGLVSDKASVPVRAGSSVEVRLVLAPGATLAGTVVDAADGSEIGACQVETGLGDTAACDHAGRFVIGPFAPGELSMQVSAPGYAPRQVTVSIDSRRRATATVTLTRGATIAGTVFDPEHRPFAGAQIRTEHYSLSGTPPMEVQALSGAGGRFTLAGVAPGRARFLAVALGYAETEGVELVVAAGDRRDGVELVLTTGGAITGTVDSGGQPVSAAQIQALRVADKRVMASAVSIADGTFRLDGLTPGRYSVIASAQGAKAISPGVKVEAREEATVKLTLGSDAIDGEVKNASGEPVAGASVSAVSAFAGGVGTQSAITDEHGNFHLIGLTGAPYRVEARADKQGSVERRGVAAGDHLSLVLPGAGALHGLVTDEDGHALNDYDVHLVPQDEKATGGVGNRFRTEHIVTPEGEFRMEDVVAGKYAVRVEAAGYEQASQSVDVPAGGAADVKLTLASGARIHGHVMHEGTPVAGCTIRPSSNGAITDVNGEFTATGVRFWKGDGESPGHLWVWAACPGQLSASSRVDVTGDDVETTLEAKPEEGWWANPSNQDFGGVGMPLSKEGDHYQVGDIFDGSPAGMAGLLSGDIIQNVDGWSPDGASLGDVVDHIRGDIGTPVTITVRRPSTGETFQVVPERGRIIPN